MRIGPLHVIRDRTYQALRTPPNSASNPLFPCVMHAPTNFPPIEAVMTDADVLDAKSLHVVERLVQSFHRCLAFDAKRPAASLWAGVEQQEGKRGFFEA